MSAVNIALFTIDFPDPNAISYNNNKFNTLNSSVSFQYRLPNNFRTLSTKGVNGDPYGLLFVPDLQSDGCKKQEEAAGVPTNATRLDNLPQNQNYALIAFAPWIGSCMEEYFASARMAPTKGMLVYQTNMGNAQPPVLNDPSWNISDGGSWQSANNFPVYALSTTTGDNIATQLGQYSGNITDVPNGDVLQQQFDSTDYIRIWGTVSTDSGTQLPSLWVFLVIVLAILLVAVSITSITMHVIQRRRRNALRHRVINGDIDLEALGVKRLTVSQQLLDKLPIYTYTANESANATASDEIPKTPPPPTAVVGASSAWSQPTCPICLEDFETNTTKVRELPCHHIFHPDCIDTFLLRNSSLCPVCKQSVLPKGECPVEITNLMVRRERHIARLRSRNRNGASAPELIPPTPFASLRNRIGGFMAGRQNSSEVQAPSADVELGNTANQAPVTDTPAATVTPPPPVASTTSNPRDCEPGQNRREWARQRAQALLGNRPEPQSEVGAAEDTGPRWKRAFRKVFPGF